MKEKKNILFIYPKLSSFISQDIDILNTKYKVIEFNFKVNNKLLVPFYFVKLLFIILYHFKKLDFILTSFGGYQSFIPSLFTKFFKKKSYIIVHGTDCTSIPKYNYGNFNKALLSWILKISYQHATKILPVSESLIHNKNDYDEYVGEQGILTFIKDLKTPFEVVYNGCDIKRWFNDKNATRIENSFITVVSGISQFEIKGIDLILAVAKTCPQYKFTIVGIDKDSLPFRPSENVIVYPHIPQNELKPLFNSHQFYLQLSLTEGFGMALCEAMLSELIPIGSNVNMIPQIIGETGLILKKRDLNLLKEVISNASHIKNKESLAKLARQRIIDNYSLEQRRTKLIKAF